MANCYEKITTLSRTNEQLYKVTVVKVQIIRIIKICKLLSNKEIVAKDFICLTTSGLSKNLEQWYVSCESINCWKQFGNLVVSSKIRNMHMPMSQQLSNYMYIIWENLFWCSQVYMYIKVSTGEMFLRFKKRS